jgi:hypothetical protein
MTHASGVVFGAALCALFTVGCGGAQPEPKKPAAEPTQSSEPTAKSDVGETSGADTTESKASEDGPAAKTDTASASDPTFPENASVDQATAAVPKGVARSNIDPDRLAEPLQQ